MKERLNYIRDGKYFVGYPVNIKGVTIQAKSLEELVKKGKIMCQVMLNSLNEKIDQEQPFELKEYFNTEEWLNEGVFKLREELGKYKNLFGELNYE